MLKKGFAVALPWHFSYFFLVFFFVVLAAPPVSVLSINQFGYEHNTHTPRGTGQRVGQVGAGRQGGRQARRGRQGRASKRTPPSYTLHSSFFCCRCLSITSFCGSVRQLQRDKQINFWPAGQEGSVAGGGGAWQANCAQRAPHSSCQRGSSECSVVCLGSLIQFQIS